MPHRKLTCAHGDECCFSSAPPFLWQTLCGVLEFALADMTHVRYDGRALRCGGSHEINFSVKSMHVCLVDTTGLHLSFPHSGVKSMANSKRQFNSHNPHLSTA